MDILVALCLLVFVGTSVALYVTRKSSTPLVRVSLALVIVLAGGMTAWRASVLDERAEKVWHASAVEWKSTPVLVWADPSFSEYDSAIKGAVKTWNGRLGFEFFRLTTDRASAQVVIRPSDGTPCGKDDDGTDKKAAASACLLFDHVDIQIRRIDELGQAFRVFLHELGHSIGLDHDDIGAMAPEALEPRAGDFPEYLLPSNKDIAAIRAKYAH